MSSIDPRLLSILDCPRCRSDLELLGDRLFCQREHSYPVVDGVPVFVIPEKEQTIDIALASYHAAADSIGAPLYLETIGLSNVEKAGIEASWAQRKSIGPIDPAISYLIGATSGLGYVNLIGRLDRYPLPNIPIGLSPGKLLLDVGCSWGRWSVSAARRGWHVVGVDPSLGAIMAGRRAFPAEQNIMFVCGDARFLPFKANTFNYVFSYSVIQHFSEIDAETALREIGRILRHSGCSMIQMAHRGGVRSSYVRTRSNHRNEGVFRVRYWSLSQIKTVFRETIGPCIVRPEAFGGLGLLAEDWSIVSGTAKCLIAISVTLKTMAKIIKPLIRIADSVYVISARS